MLLVMFVLEFHVALVEKASQGKDGPQKAVRISKNTCERF